MANPKAALQQDARLSPAPLSIRKTYAGKHILIAGASGFLGKVWLAMLLDRLPEIGKISVLIRKKGDTSGRERFEKMLNSSYVFKNLHDQHGAKLAEYVELKVEIIEGDVSQPGLGISKETAARLAKEIDLFVNCAGLVEFNPDIREAVAVNVEGTLHAADFVGTCERAAMLHVSTCYVAGTREGRIAETIESETSPNGKPFDAAKELIDLRAAAEKIVAEHKGKRRKIREEMIAAGTRRAEKWGWTNTYTYTKAMAEALLTERKNLRFSVFRPAIVESSLSYPFPGWNEGFNTCGPLAYLLGTWFRYLPAKAGNPFDIVPVDIVCNGLTVAGAALMLGREARVYQCGTSDENLLTIDRAAKLTSLSHRIHYRLNGKTIVERVVRSRWRTVPVRSDHPLAAANMREVTRSFGKLLDELSTRAPKLFRVVAAGAKDFTKKTDRKLEQIDKMLKLFMPFIHDYHHVFETSALSSVDVEEAEFRFNPKSFDWRDYWLDVHMPGLRRWCFPPIEGKEVEQL